MSRRPRFSVLISNYNYGRYLGAAVRSVLKQTVQDFEVIIVDDGSIDNSPAVIRRLALADPRIRAFAQSNGGQAAAFNRAFAESRGEIISFLDADDLWLPEKLELVERVLRSAGRTVALVQHNMRILRPGGPRSTLYRPTLVSGDVFEQIATLRQIDYFAPTSAVSIPRAVLSKVLPAPEQLRICTDAYVTRAALAHGRLFSIDLPLGCYRIHGRNCWTENSDRPNPGMVAEEIIPLVLDYYRRCGLQTAGAEDCVKRPPNREAALTAHVVLDRIRRLKSRYPRIALYGAGSHTRWLMDLLIRTGTYPDHMSALAAVVDDRGSRCLPVAGLAVQPPDAVARETLNAVILSSDCFQPQMRERLEQVFGWTDVAIVDLYEGLPAGPYAKIAAGSLPEPQGGIRT